MTYRELCARLNTGFHPTTEITSDYKYDLLWDRICDELFFTMRGYQSLTIRVYDALK